MNKKILFSIALALGSGLLSGCRTQVSTPENYSYRFYGDTVKVLNSSFAEHLKIQAVQPTDYRKNVTTAGIVRPIPYQYANIASPFAGRIVASYAKLGEYIKKGSPIFEIICPDFTAAQKDFFQAKSERELAEKDLRRKEDLINNGVSSQKELEEAQNALIIAEKDFENAKSALEVYLVDDFDSMTLGQPLVVRAPISGELIENSIVTGQYLKDDDDPVAVIADLSKVWISANVKEKDIRFIDEGSSPDIEISAYPGKKINGTIFHIEEEVDEDTRSVMILSECENEDEMLKLGMYATIRFTSEPIEMCLVPEKAVLQGSESSYVFVYLAPNTFLKKDVKVESTVNGNAVISEGLETGDRIISEGGYYLKQ